jgi:hypothetical protein
MLDWWEEDEDLPWTQIICPADLGSEGRMSATFNACNFFVDRRCQIHALKPIEGRLAIHDPAPYDWKRLHLEVARTWNTASGRRVADLWTKHFCR